MSGESRTVASLKGQLSKFSGINPKRFNKPKKRLMGYGIQASRDVKLSNIARTLKETQSLIKMKDRLSRNLDGEDFNRGINEEICRLRVSQVREDMVIAIDRGGDPELLYEKYLGGEGCEMICDSAQGSGRDSSRYIKQCYKLEDIRVQSYIGIRNTVALVLAVSYFASVYFGQSIKLRMLVEGVFPVLSVSSECQAFSTMQLPMGSLICSLPTRPLSKV